MLRAIFCFLILAVVPLHTGSPIVRNGSAMEKSIPPKQHGAKAVQEEMDWMMRLYHYTPNWPSRRGSEVSS